MAANMNLIVKKCFPEAKWVTDRFHVQKPVSVIQAGKNGPYHNDIEHIYYLNSILISRKLTNYLTVFARSITVKYLLTWPEQNLHNGSTR